MRPPARSRLTEVVSSRHAHGRRLDAAAGKDQWHAPPLLGEDGGTRRTRSDLDDEAGSIRIRASVRVDRVLLWRVQSLEVCGR